MFGTFHYVPRYTMSIFTFLFHLVAIVFVTFVWFISLPACLHFEISNGVLRLREKLYIQERVLVSPFNLVCSLPYTKADVLPLFFQGPLRNGMVFFIHKNTAPSMNPHQWRS